MSAPPEADRTVTSSTELQTAFGALTPGDTIYISPENAPYRTTGWLDIDVDDVSVLGPGRPGLVEPVDYAGAGGIRIGHHRHCENVLVRGFGFDGNREGQRDSAERLHGIAVRDATGVTLAGNDIRGTHPLQHGDGGSGISVTRHCANVRVVGNRVRDAGDRGIQVASDRTIVAGNDVVGSLDRAISGDLWYPDGKNYSARHLLVAGNLVGDSVEGSLTGVARNEPRAARHGAVTIVGNVGFGAHKSFCHVRGPASFRNVTVQHNTAVQATEGLETENNDQYSGVAVDAAGGRTVSIRNNDLHGYSGHGVNVDGDIRDVTIEGNTLTDATLTGVRVRGVVGGTVTDNLVVDAGQAGVRLVDARDLRVGENYVRGPAHSGIDVRGPEGTSRAGRGTAGHELVDNFVVEAGGSDGAPGIRVCDAGVRVRGNTVRRPGGHAVAECRGTGQNSYEANHADGSDPWRIRSPDARTRNNVPQIDVHRGLDPGPEQDALVVAFDRPYARPPRVTFGRRGGAVESISYRTDDAGNVVGAEIEVASAGPLDLFVEDV